MENSSVKTITVLGATGSIGDATLDIMREQRAKNGSDSIKVKALTANSNWKKLAKLVHEFHPEFIALADGQFENDLREAIAGFDTQIGIGPDALITAAACDAHWVMAAITGAAGLPSVLEAAKRGCVLALANKEALVCSGSLLMSICAKNGTTLLPVDSEHNAIFQVFDPAQSNMVEKIILTASGGPFLSWSFEQIKKATPAQAIAHPVWAMGSKISVDSASLMNKGLEIIEARHLFDVSPSQIDVLVHPQSVVHGLVQYKDGSLLAQLGAPDMRVPIAHAWAWPNRIVTSVKSLCLSELSRLDFEPPDDRRFPALNLAKHAMAAGGNSCNALNAANEVAVALFLQGNLGFGQIAELISTVMNSKTSESDPWRGEPQSFEQVFEIDKLARYVALQSAQRLQD